MRGILIVGGALIAAVFITQLRNATAETCAESCEKAYAACSKGCKQTDCFTKCINEKESCLAQCR